MNDPRLQEDSKKTLVKEFLPISYKDNEIEDPKIGDEIINDSNKPKMTDSIQTESKKNLASPLRSPDTNPLLNIHLSPLKAKYLAAKEKIRLVEEEKLKDESLQENNEKEIVSNDFNTFVNFFKIDAAQEIKIQLTTQMKLIARNENNAAEETLSDLISDPIIPEYIPERIPNQILEQTTPTKYPTTTKLEKLENEYLQSVIISGGTNDRKAKRDAPRLDFFDAVPKKQKQQKADDYVKKKPSTKKKIPKSFIKTNPSTPLEYDDKEPIRKSRFDFEIQDTDDSITEILPFDWKSAFEKIGKNAYLKINKEIQRLKDHAYPQELLELNLNHSKLLQTLKEFDPEESEFILTALESEQASRLVKRNQYERRNKLSEHIGTICVSFDFDLPEKESTIPLYPYQRTHLTGSSRSEGYYKTTDKEKLKFRGKSNIIDLIDSTITDKSIELTAKATSRASRVQSRNLTHGLEVQERAYTSAQTVNVDGTVLKFNQLSNRKKGLKFGKSAIHDWGLFAMERVDMNDIVIEYIGEKIRQKVYLFYGVI